MNNLTCNTRDNSGPISKLTLQSYFHMCCQTHEMLATWKHCKSKVPSFFRLQSVYSWIRELKNQLSYILLKHLLWIMIVHPNSFYKIKIQERVSIISLFDRSPSVKYLIIKVYHIQSAHLLTCMMKIPRHSIKLRESKHIETWAMR